MALKILQAWTSRPHSILHTQIAVLPLRTWVTSFYIHFDKLCHLHAWPFLGTSTRAKDEFDWRQLTPMSCPRTQGVLQRAYLQSEITSQDLAQVENGWRCKLKTVLRKTTTCDPTADAFSLQAFATPGDWKTKSWERLGTADGLSGRLFTRVSGLSKECLRCCSSWMLLVYLAIRPYLTWKYCVDYDQCPEKHTNVMMKWL